jgi:hypothetical protein
MIIVTMTVNFPLHGLAKLFRIIGFHGLVIVKGILVHLGQESNGIHHLVGYFRFKIRRQHLVCRWEGKVTLFNVASNFPGWFPQAVGPPKHIRIAI